jgi:hypothetical protein
MAFQPWAASLSAEFAAWNAQLAERNGRPKQSRPANPENSNGVRRASGSGTSGGMDENLGHCGVPFPGIEVLMPVIGPEVSHDQLP